MKKILMTLSVPMLLLTACGSEDDTRDLSGCVPSFSASIDGQTSTRAYDAVWERGDAIGIFGKSGSVEYSNVQYTTDGSGAFRAAGLEIYFQDNNTVSFTAYYPYAPAEAGFAIDTRKQKDQKALDYLWAQTQGSKANPEVSFIFSHKMAKVALTLKKGADVSYDEIKAVEFSLGALRHQGEFDVAEGKAVASGAPSDLWKFAGNASGDESNAPVLANNDAETLTYTLILLPQAFDSALPLQASLSGKQDFKAAVDFTAANAGAGDADSGNALVAGRQYNLSVTLHKTGISVNGCMITPWQEADGGNIDAK